MKALLVISASIEQARKKQAGENTWGARHAQAFVNPQRRESGIVAMIRSLATYADNHESAYGSPIGQDYVLGAAWLDMLKGWRQLLNGELGRLDGGTLDSLAYDLAEAVGFKREELD
jgi:hypothetical protein